MIAAMSSPAPEVSVFFSYSHETPDHKSRVLSLAKRLHDEGFVVLIDEMRIDPAEAWEAWMRRSIKQASFVFVVCTETYRKRFEHDEKVGVGLGAKWEGAIISRTLYEDESLNRKFIPVVFSSADVQHIPDLLRGATYFTLDCEDNIVALLRRLRGTPKFIFGPRGQPTSLHSVTPEPLRFDQAHTRIESRLLGAQPEVETEGIESIDSGIGTVTSGIEAPPIAALGRTDSPALCDPAKRFVHIPFIQKGSQVIGRETELAAVREQLVSGHRTAIGQTASFQGLGGLGKTQLAIEYAYAFEHEYPGGVYWFNADQDLEGQLCELAVLGSWVSPLSDLKEKFEIARHQIRTRAKTLLIFDNVEDVSFITPFLPEPSLGAHILTTSRLPLVGFVGVPIELLPEKDAVTMLFSEAGSKPTGAEEFKYAQEIVRSLDGLPLAIELAGAYLQYRPIGLKAYYEKLRGTPREALPGKFLSSFTHHEADIFRTLHIAENVVEEEPLLRPALDLLTWSGTAPMGLSLLAAILQPVTGEVELRVALAHGVKLKLLQQTPGTDRFSIHRLVSEVRREEVPLSALSPSPELVVSRLCEWFEKRREHFAQLSAYEAEIDHLKAWEKHSRVVAPAAVPKLMWLQGYPPFHRGNGPSVRIIMEAALTLPATDEPANEAIKAHLLNDLGWGEANSGDRKRARELFEASHELRLRCLGPQHLDTAASMENVARALAEDAEFAEALDLARRALAIRKTHLGDNHPKTAEALNALGIVFQRMGDLTAARTVEEEALAVCLRQFGEFNPFTAQTHLALGATLHALGEVKLALGQAVRAQETFLTLFGEMNLGYAIALGNVTLLHWDIGRQREAISMAERHLAIVSEIIGENHPEHTRSLLNLGGFLLETGDRLRGQQLMERSLKLRLASFGVEHPEVAVAYGAIGTVSYNTSDYAQAVSCYKKALAIRLKVLGRDHPSTLTSQRSLVNALFKLGRFEEATMRARRAWETSVQLHGKSHQASVAIARTLAAILQQRDEIDAARVILSELLPILPRHSDSRRAIERDLAALRAPARKRGSNHTPPRRKRRR